MFDTRSLAPAGNWKTATGNGERQKVLSYLSYADLLRGRLTANILNMFDTAILHRNTCTRTFIVQETDQDHVGRKTFARTRSYKQ